MLVYQKVFHISKGPGPSVHELIGILLGPGATCNGRNPWKGYHNQLVDHVPTKTLGFHMGFPGLCLCETLYTSALCFCSCVTSFFSSVLTIMDLDQTSSRSFLRRCGHPPCFSDTTWMVPWRWPKGFFSKNSRKRVTTLGLNMFWNKALSCFKIS